MRRAQRPGKAMTEDTNSQADGTRLDGRVGRLVPERSCEQGCNGCEDCTDYDGGDDECPRCHGDGMDPWTDYALPCPECGGMDAP